MSSIASRAGSDLILRELECTIGRVFPEIDAFLRLPVEERARLALELIRSLDGDPGAGVAETWDTEIEGRGAEVDAGTAETITLEEYRAHVRARTGPRARK